MKKFSKILCVLLVLTISLLGSTGTVFATQENIGLSNSPIYLIHNGTEMFGIDKPYNSEWDLSKEGRYSFSGYCHDHYLYTNYTFTGANSVWIQVTNTSTKTITVKLLKQQLGVDWSVSTQKIEPNTALGWPVKSLDKSAYYYLQFSKGSKIGGYIEAN